MPSLETGISDGHRTHRLTRMFPPETQGPGTGTRRPDSKKNIPSIKTGFRVGNKMSRFFTI